jgi:hypothetical protein
MKCYLTCLGSITDLFTLKEFQSKVMPICSGRAIAQAVSRRLPTMAVRVRARVISCGICGGQSGMGQVFSEHFSFP